MESQKNSKIEKCESEPSAARPFERSVLNSARIVSTRFFDEAAAKAYADLVLKNCSEEEAIAALERLMAHSEYLPRPAEVIEEADRARAQTFEVSRKSMMIIRRRSITGLEYEYILPERALKTGERLVDRFETVSVPKGFGRPHITDGRPIVHWSKSEARKKLRGSDLIKADDAVKSFKITQEDSWTHSS